MTRHVSIASLVGGLLLATPAWASSIPSPSLWHPLRPSVSTFGPEIDRLYWVCFWLTGVIFIAVELVLLYFAFKYRAVEGGKAKFTHGNSKLEAIWTITPAVILVLLAAISKVSWDRIRVDIPEDAVEVECIAQQFDWFFRFPGVDGTFGPRDADRLATLRANNDTSNPWVVDTEFMPDDWEGDYAPGIDDVMTQSEVRVPADRPVRILLTSNDVLHSFFIPEFRIKHDAVPGMNGGRLWFEVPWEKVKDREYYDIVCAELCGLNHYSMRGKLVVMPSGDIEESVDEVSIDEMVEKFVMYDEDYDTLEIEAIDENNPVLSSQLVFFYMEDTDLLDDRIGTNWETYACAMSKLIAAEQIAAEGGGDDY